MKEELKELLKNAYAAYSNYKVAAILITKDDKKFKGVNVENLSFGATICAERNAIANAITNGYQKGDFKELHVMNSSNEIGMPCMLCRQVMNEFFEGNTKIFVYNQKGDIKTFTKEELCPYPFDGEIKWEVDL